jgi:hypothetical protein
LEDACLNWLFFTRNVCAAFAATIEVMMATTVAMRMTPGRENFWIRIVISFILFGFFCVGFLCVSFLVSWSYELQSSS